MDSNSCQTPPNWFEEILKNSQEIKHTSGKNDSISSFSTKNHKRHPKSAEVRSVNNGLETLTNSITELNIKKNGHTSREGSARYGRRSVMNSLSAGNSPQRSSSNYDSPENLHTIENSQQFSNKELSLEESWSSLSFFDKKHRGMLSQKQDNESSAVEICDDEQAIKCQTRKISGLTDVSSSDFIIPELPKGQLMVINIKSTWGDKHYLGLNGIEIFSSLGEPVHVLKIWAEPPDINILPEYDKDPRVVSNLLDGVNRTHDDMHLWLAPFTPGSDHFINLQFEISVNVAMIRIWNYNKSRIHSYRGVRDVEITLDKTVIFNGEIARASGGILGGTESFGDTILFTTDENILELISQFDDSFNNFLCEQASEDFTLPVQRPVTADGGDERPFTCAHGISDIQSERTFQHSINTHVLEIHLLENWGHPALIGLSGVEVLDKSGEIINIQRNELECNIPSPDIYRLIDGINFTTDDSHMWNTGFLNGREVIFKITFCEPKPITSIRLWNYNASPDLVYCGVKIMSVYLNDQQVPIGFDGLFAVRRAPGNCHFNFVQEINLVDGFKQLPQEVLPKTNQVGDSFRSSLIPPNNLLNQDELLLLPCNVNGKCVNISQHQTKHSPSDNEDSGEELAQCIHPSVSCLTSRNTIGVFNNDENYEAPDMPEGFVFQLLILSTWGDMYYAGLNGLEMYDEMGKKIVLSESNIGAYPDSVNVLEGVNSDVRTPEKLIDGVNDTFDGRHMWLAPILPNQLNRVYIVFDYPVKVSMIKLWNYAKTPNRGVKEFGVLVDDLLVYNGELDQASNSPFTSHVPYRTVLFTNDKNILMQEKNTQVRHSSYGNHVRLLNDHKRVTSGGSSCYSADPMLRPVTSLQSKSKDYKV